MTDHFSDSSKKNLQPFVDTSIQQAVQTHLGKQLRNFFGPIEEEPLPDNLRRLVERLDKSLKKRGR